MTIRVSTTALESFRYVVQTDFGDEAALIAQIKGKPFAPNWQMLAGTAWHEILAGGGRGDMVNMSITSGEYTFDLGDVHDARQALGDGLCEVKAARVFDLGMPVNVVAQADHCHGLTISDVKTKFGPLDAKHYEHSLQWRFYLAVHGCERFRYLLCSFNDPKSGFCQLKDLCSFSFWNYSGLENDCRDWLQRFVSWADARNLLPYLDRSGSSLTADVAA